MDFTALSAIASTFTAVLAVFVVIIEGRRWRLALQTDLLMKLFEKFYEIDMRRLRQEAAKQFITGNFTDFEAVYELLDYFTVLGVLVKRNAISIDLTYALFEYWITRYWYWFEKYVHDLRIKHGDPELLTTFENLAKTFRKLRQKRGLQDISKREAHEFLIQESKS